jgi:sigma-B regulation protein RsbU (phosphoserine phosphatase)
LKTLQVSVIMLFGVVIFVSVLAIYRSRTVTRPVLQLAEAAKGLSEGAFDVRVDIRTGDELEDLGKAFNSMGVSLLEREKMKQSLALARKIQQHLLPSKSPQLDGFDILGGSVYCDETGGDYYDYIELDANKLGIVVGDVSGHGIGSAMVMTTARGILRSQASHQGTELVPFLADLNQHLVRDTEDSYFMTLFYAVLDSETRTCRWISGGHGPILYYSSSEKMVTELPCSGIPLGILEETEFQDMQPITMPVGTILLIGTDGIWETRNPKGELFGIQRLSSLLEKCSGASAAEIYSATMEAVVNFRDSAPQDDDVTLVVIKAI